MSRGFPQLGAAAILGVQRDRDSRRGHRYYYRMDAAWPSSGCGVFCGVAKRIGMRSVHIRRTPSRRAAWPDASMLAWFDRERCARCALVDAKEGEDD